MPSLPPLNWKVLIHSVTRHSPGTGELEHFARNAAGIQVSWLSGGTRAVAQERPAWEISPVATPCLDSFPHREMEMSGQRGFNVPLSPTKLVTKGHRDITLHGPEPAQLAACSGKQQLRCPLPEPRSQGKPAAAPTGGALMPLLTLMRTKLTGQQGRSSTILTSLGAGSVDTQSGLSCVALALWLGWLECCPHTKR